MSSTPITSPSSGATTPKSKLDTLSREDLTRFAKKQVVSLQQCKHQNESITKELELCKQTIIQLQESQNGNGSDDESVEFAKKATYILLGKGSLETNEVVESDVLLRKMQYLADTCNQTSNEMLKLETIKNENQEDIQILRQALADKGKEFDVVLEENQHLKHRLESTEDDRDQLSIAFVSYKNNCLADFEKLHAELRGKEDEIDTLRHSLQALQSSVKECGKEKELMEDKLCELRSMHDEQLNMIEREDNGLQQDLKNLKCELEEQKELNAALMKQVKSITNEKEHAMHEFEQIDSELKETRDHERNLSQEISNLKDSLETLQSYSSNSEKLQESLEDSLKLAEVPHTSTVCPRCGHHDGAIDNVTDFVPDHFVPRTRRLSGPAALGFGPTYNHVHRYGHYSGTRRKRLDTLIEVHSFEPDEKLEQKDAEIEQNKSSFSKLSNELEVVQSECMSKNDELKNVEDELEAKNEEVNRLNTTVESLKECGNQREDLLDKLSRVKNENKEMEKAIKELKERLSNTISAKEDLEMKLDSAAQASTQTESETNITIEQLQDELRMKEEEMESLRQSLQTSGEEFAKEKDIVEERLGIVGKEDTELHDDLKRLSSELEEGKEVNASLIAQLKSAVTENENAKIEYNRLDAELLEMSNREIILLEQINKLETSCLNGDAIKESLESSLKLAQEKNLELGIELEQTKSSVSLLTNQIEDAKATFDLKTNEMKNLENEFEAIKEMLPCALKAKEDLERKVEDLTAHLHTQTESETEAATEKEDLAKITCALNEQKEANASLLEQIKCAAKEKETAKDAFEAEFMEIRDRENIHLIQITELKTSLEQIQTQLSKDKELKEGLEESLRLAKEELHTKVEILKDSESKIEELGDELETAKEESKEMEKEIRDLKESLACEISAKERIDNYFSHISTQTEQAMNSDQKIVIEQLTSDLDRRVSELSKVKCELADVKSKWESVRMDESSQNVLSLEMADFERSLKQTRQELQHEQVLLLSKTNENAALQKELDAVRLQKTKETETTKKFRAVLVKTKKEMAENAKILSEKVSECANIQLKYESVCEELESLKLELSTSVAGGSQRVSNLESSVNSLQRQLMSTQQYKDRVIQELEAMRGEYDAYKAKVATVLKQQQNRSPSESVDAEERELLQQSVQELQQKLTESSVLCRTAQDELISLQEEYERLAAKQRETQSNGNNKERSLRDQLEQMRLEMSEKDVNHSEIVKQLQEQCHNIKIEHDSRVTQMEYINVERLGDLQSKLSSAQNELEIWKAKSVNGDWSPIGDTLDDCTEMPPFTERKPGEGSEAPSAEPVHVHMSNRPARLQYPLQWRGADDGVKSPVPDIPSPIMTFTHNNPMNLEDLLNSDQLSVSSLPLSADAVEVSAARLDKAIKRINNLSEVLNESEAANARLAEQTKLLKEEIRRLERNAERQAHLNNNEYLKNVILKFLTPRLDDERCQLVPVLATMLRLSQEEVERLNDIAKGDEVKGNSDSKWSNYLHRWSGLT